MTRKSGVGPPICVWWIGAGAPPRDVLDEVRLHLERVFGVEARLWLDAERPANAFDPARGQSSSTRILEWLLEAGPAEPRKLVAVTDTDLFISILTFVFGEAQLGGRAAVVSTARLVPVRTAESGDRLLVARLAKEAAHELGHSFGLVHCGDGRCVMSRSASLIDVDAKNGGFCHDCWTRYMELSDSTGVTHE